MGHGIERILDEGVEVDCFGFAGREPWHRLGQRVGDAGDPNITLEDIMDAARARWRVAPEPVRTGIDGERVEGVNALVRDVDRRVLSLATDRYSIIQNEDLGRVLDVVVSTGAASYETCGILHEGKRFFVSARLKTIEARPGDPTETFALITSSHDGSGTASILLTSIRTVCANTLAIAMNGANHGHLHVRHVGDVEAGLRRARDVVLGVHDGVARLHETLVDLTRLNLNTAQAARFRDIVVPVPALPDAEEFRVMPEEKKERLLAAQATAHRAHQKIADLHESHVGQELAVRGSAYAHLQSVTAFTTHMLKSSGKLESMMVGRAAQLGQRAYAAFVDPATRAEILNVAA